MVVIAVVMALSGWMRLEEHIEQRITTNMKPVQTEIGEVQTELKGHEAQYQASLSGCKLDLKDQGAQYQTSLGEINVALTGVRKELQMVRASLARLEGERARRDCYWCLCFCSWPSPQRPCRWTGCLACSTTWAR